MNSLTRPKTGQGIPSSSRRPASPEISSWYSAAQRQERVLSKHTGAQAQGAKGERCQRGDAPHTSTGAARDPEPSRAVQQGHPARSQSHLTLSDSVHRGVALTSDRHMDQREGTELQEEA